MQVSAHQRDASHPFSMTLPDGAKQDITRLVNAEQCLIVVMLRCNTRAPVKYSESIRE
jgi:hypothetical protein